MLILLTVSVTGQILVYSSSEEAPIVPKLSLKLK
uniref:Uncharacterized protein n=1 Tax=Anguilla anguilla TaxID=7936 RepID=A0A0E9SW41_ANGAN